MTINLTPAQILVGLGVLAALLVVTRVGTRRGRDTARGGALLGSLAGRVLGAAGVMLGAQWYVITHPGNLTLLLVALALPDLITAYVLTRALTVTAMDGWAGRGDGRR
jgi:hypothetical protein